MKKHKDFPLSSVSSYRTGGPADFYYEVKNTGETLQAVNECSGRNIPFKIIGRASNILFSDRGFRGAIIRMKGEGIFAEAPGKVFAGECLKEFINFCIKKGLGGLERLSGVPGTVGGAVYMNAGAYGTEIKDSLKEAAALMPDGSIKIFKAEECEMEYRKSLFSSEKLPILYAGFNLTHEDPEKLSRTALECLSLRREKQPLNYPSCGSVFKRPAGNYAGKLIEETGLKGFCINGACVSEKHSNFIVNKDGASSSDIKSVIDYVRNKVYEKTGIMLETEVELAGEW
ncbi:MAG: UDP-N-acetylmuramate dehydrogenase [Fibrobacterota bacterium]